MLLLCATTPAIATVSISLGYPHKAFKSGIRTSTPMLALQFEQRIRHFGIAGIICAGLFEGYTEENIANVYSTSPAEGGLIILGLRGNYYFIQKERFEVYAGVMASVLACDNGIYLKKRSANTTVWGSSTIYGSRGEELASESEGIKGGLQVGARYWLRSHFGLMAEVSYGTSLVNVGIILRRRP
ncbi:MAG: hypothetical protein BGO69_11855 [Bacteroidetes bacterium 46-16]|nr:MAG: hypothetical protein BGO69_11855 [Bacteroidetes bacterium 46-16]